jgi:hypothetical protein
LEKESCPLIETNITMNKYNKELKHSLRKYQNEKDVMIK